MLKKPPNSVIKIQVLLKGTQKMYGFKVGIHTFIKEIENLVAEELGLDLLRTNISIQHQKCYGTLNSSSTLYQNKITGNSETLYACIDTVFSAQLAKSKNEVGQKATGKMTSLDMTFKMAKKQKGIVNGINIESVCINPKCINNNRGLIHPIGHGEYDIFKLLKGIECTACPYRDLHINLASMTKEIKLKNCVYTVKGVINQRYGKSQHDIGCWVVVETEDSSFLNKIMAQHDWAQATLVSKPRQPQKGEPLLL